MDLGLGQTNIILKCDHLRTIPTKFGSNWPSSSEKIFNDFFDEFSIFSHGGHLGCQVESSDIILKANHIIPAKFGPNWPSSFRED